MSDRTHAAFVDTVQGVISEFLGGDSAMMTGFVLSVDYIDSDGERCWEHAEAEAQSITSTLGQLRWYSLFAEQKVIDSLEGDDA